MPSIANFSIQFARFHVIIDHRLPPRRQHRLLPRHRQHLPSTRRFLPLLPPETVVRNFCRALKVGILGLCWAYNGINANGSWTEQHAA
ncbi:hypothetical protein BC938DRAFT_482410 [Jimgerdemannia flammicorona]|uniref:Uncharacterized protein n=1 Tax=Jimgerdemannia flammicorona TaxID=994334 RepID=A0A433QWL4_9FUNG|nr:hypothetical protein BC938DRAFT_482410 [Jimgerdemannia flammicorona]